MVALAWAQASRATAWSRERSSESHVKPSPIAHQSTPSRSRHTVSSPTRHSPDFTNCTTATCQSRATARTTTPNAAVDLPLPSPVFTITTLAARRRGAGWWCSVGTPSVLKVTERRREAVEQRQDGRGRRGREADQEASDAERLEVVELARARLGSDHRHLHRRGIAPGDPELLAPASQAPGD